MAPSFSIDNHVHRLARALMHTESQGIRIDLEYTTELGVELKQHMDKVQTAISDCTQTEREMVEYDLWSEKLDKEVPKLKTEKGRIKKAQNMPKPEFNFNSSDHLGRLLYEKLGLPPKKTPKGSWMTRKGYLEQIEHLHPVPRHIMDHNRFKSYYGTFVEGILNRAVGDRIHPEFNVNGTDTGRISHENPNMGNMPSRDEEWSTKIRGQFLPDEGEVIAKSDYSQLEVVVAAHYSQDKNLLKIIRDGASLHDITNEGLGIGDRSKAKTLNFAMQYLCWWKRVQLILDCSEREAKRVWNGYWELYSGQKQVIDGLARQVDNGQTIESIFGRKRHFEHIKRNPGDKAYRQAYSFLIQGTGGDLMNRAFYLSFEEYKKKGIGRAGFTIHDEGLMFPKKEYAEEGLAILEKNMVQSGIDMGLSVPLKVEGETGLTRWKK